MGDRYVPGFAPDLRFLRSQILCRLFYKSSLDETVNRGPCVHTRVKRSHMHVKDPVAHVRVRQDYGNTKIIQQALKSVTVFTMFKLDTIRKKKKKKKNSNKSSGSLYFNEPLKPIVFSSFTSLVLTRACAELSLVELPEKYPHARTHTHTQFHCVETPDGETLG